MRTEFCERLGIEFPIFAFTHCRDVVAAVSKAGGLRRARRGRASRPSSSRSSCQWIDEHIGDKPYGVDIVIPGKYEGMGEIDPEKLEEQLRAAVPAAAPRVRRQAAGRPRRSRDPAGGEAHHELLGWTLATATPQLEVALAHDKVKLIANALGHAAAGGRSS